MNPLYEQVSLRARHGCESAPEIIFNFPFEVEHIIPKSLNGTDTLSNLALSCRSCNLYKSIHITGISPDGLERVPLFNPRNDKWNKHFTVNLEDGEILDLTDIGRATLLRLQMNKGAQLFARKQRMLLNIFP